MDEDFGPSDLEAIRLSPRVGDRLSWHLVTCTLCEGDEMACELGQALTAEHEAVVEARAAYMAVSPEQRRLLLEDWWKEALRGDEGAAHGG